MTSVNGATATQQEESDEPRARAAGMTEEKRVSFRLTPTVRYYNRTHRASFAEELQEQHPLYASLRDRREQRRWKRGIVESVRLGDREKHVKSCVESAFSVVHTAIRELHSGRGDSAVWKPRRRSRSSSHSGELYEREQEKAKATTSELVVSCAIQCSAEELFHIVATTPADELTASMLSCLDDRLDANALLTSVEMSIEDIKQRNQSARAAADSASKEVALKRVALPRSSLRTIQKGDKRAATKLIEVFTATSKDGIRSRVLAVLPAPPETFPPAMIGFVVDAEPAIASESPSVRVSLYVCRRSKRSKSFPWSSESSGGGQSLCNRLDSVLSLLKSYVVRRRLGFQVLAYPDIVYGTDDLQDVQQDHPKCHLCRRDFNFLRRRQFCHLCALWICTKCVIETAVERPVGWCQPVMNFCVACAHRIQQCSFEGAAVPTEPMVPILPSQHSSVDDCMETLAKTWCKRAKAAPPASDRHTLLLTMTALVQCLPHTDQTDATTTNHVIQRVLDGGDDQSLSSLLLVVPPRSVASCRLNHDADGRQYELLFDDATCIPRSPVTMDERDRIRHVDRILDSSAAFPSLDLLCSLAATELQCAAVFISVVHERHTIRVATSDTSLPPRFARDDGFDGYTLQSMSPLVVLDMARDVRSRQFTLTQRHDARFFCGVPVLSPDGGVIVATFNAVDTSPRHAVATSWYARFVALAHATRSLLGHATTAVAPRIAPAA